MSKESGLGDHLFINGYDLSGNAASVGISTPVAQLEVPDITLSGMARLNGQVDGKLTFKAWFDVATEAEHAALKALPTTNVIITYCRGATAGNAAFWFTAKQVNYDWDRGADGSLAGSIECILADGTIPEWGEMVTAGKVTHASATSSASIDDAAATTAGVAVVVQIVDIGAGTGTLILEHSSDNASWATKLSMTAVVAGSDPTAERKTTTGTVNRYLRATSTGGGLINEVFVMARRRGTSVDRVAY